MVYPFSAGCEVQRFIRFIRFFHEPDSRENCHCRDTWLMMVFKESEIMDEKELRILERAITYTSMLAEGIDPLSRTRAPQDDVIHQERIRKYLQYVEGVLRSYRYDKLNPPAGRKRTIPFSITPEQLKHYRFSDEPVTAAVISRQLDELSAAEGMKTMKAADISAWLIKTDFLEEIQYYGKTMKIPTEQGKNAGIYAAEEVNSRNERYIRVTYGKPAQQLIIRNLGSIIGSYVSPSAKKKLNG